MLDRVSTRSRSGGIRAFQETSRSSQTTLWIHCRCFTGNHRHSNIRQQPTTLHVYSTVHRFGELCVPWSYRFNIMSSHNDRETIYETITRKGFKNYSVVILLLFGIPYAPMAKSASAIACCFKVQAVVFRGSSFGPNSGNLGTFAF